ncbi:hypothetical protein NBRC116492_15120 [Aurantivibrio infirmus]
MKIFRLKLAILLSLLSIHCYSIDYDQCKKDWKEYMSELKGRLKEEKSKLSKIVIENYEKKIALSSDEFELYKAETDYKTMQAFLNSDQIFMATIDFIDKEHKFYYKDKSTGEAECIVDTMLPIETHIEFYINGPKRAGVEWDQ